MWRTLISAGVLASVCPPTLIEAVLAQAGKASQRERRLPAPAVVYCVMALALWRAARGAAGGGAAPTGTTRCAGGVVSGPARLAVDGSCMAVADEAANAEFFGYPAASRGQTAFPPSARVGAGGVRHACGGGRRHRPLRAQRDRDGI